MCEWMYKENKGNTELLAKWFFLKFQNVVESIQNSNVDLLALIMQGRRLRFYFKERKMLFSAMKVNLQICSDRLSVIHRNSTVSEYLKAELNLKRTGQWL